MPSAEQYPFVSLDPSLGRAGLLPYLPLTLIYGQQKVSVMALLDTGSTVNVLPFDVGQQLGFIWDQQMIPVCLSGSLSQAEARAAVTDAMAGSFQPIRLAFAWTKSNQVPVILGQTNFFLEFDVSFYRSREIFEIRPK